MKPKVAFVCVHNSCRSQMAEAVAKQIASSTFDAYSAGTEIVPRINQDAVKLMKEKYQIDMEKTQKSKLVTDLPTVDIVITMGCNVDCPHLPCKYREDWGLDDPTGMGEDAFNKTLTLIEEKMRVLKVRIENSKVKGV